MKSKLKRKKRFLKKSKMITRTPPNENSDSRKKNREDLNNSYFETIISKLKIVTGEIANLKKDKVSLGEIKEELLNIRENEELKIQVKLLKELIESERKKYEYKIQNVIKNATLKQQIQIFSKKVAF